MSRTDRIKTNALAVISCSIFAGILMNADYIIALGGAW